MPSPPLAPPSIRACDTEGTVTTCGIAKYSSGHGAGKIGAHKTLGNLRKHFFRKPRLAGIVRNVASPYLSRRRQITQTQGSYEQRWPGLRTRTSRGSNRFAKIHGCGNLVANRRGTHCKIAWRTN